ncbi:hypothetical protein BDN72DRAFT_840114 [Pluteus cervinus]|uniref:Uncharacterized protein n=1 Tax=Pluteus cervinus TaxID=181527 RepID=A0ACD3AVM5_9AGAR|nr:hypothetical protein BDN72DRAFT_840114 [Pluteus cervinus]
MSTHSNPSFLVVRASSSSPPLSEEIACYSLPYGGLGFVSHLLTYYTVTCLCAGRRPLWPLHKINASRLDIVLGLVSLCVTTAMGVITLVRCRHSWQLFTIGIWKLGINGRDLPRNEGVSIPELPTRRVSPRKENAFTVALGAILNASPYTISLWWGVLYVHCMYVGLAGLIALLVKHWSTASGSFIGLTVTWSCITVLATVGSYLFADRITPKGLGPHSRYETREDEISLGSAYGVGLSFIVLSALYCDWALGIMTGNLAGLPSKDNSALYWTYFLFKRLTMFSS